MSSTKLRIGRETRIEVYSHAGIWIAPPLMLREIARCGFEVKAGDIQVRAVGALRRCADSVDLVVDQPQGAGIAFRLDRLPPNTPDTLDITGRWTEGRLTVVAWKRA